MCCGSGSRSSWRKYRNRAGNGLGIRRTALALDEANLSGMIFCNTTMPDGSVNNSGYPAVDLQGSARHAT